MGGGRIGRIGGGGGGGGIDGIDGIDLQVMATTIDETATTNTNPWKSTTKPMSCG